ncbi:hypothetical protein HBN50_07075 [Halobacteriovorax sp. GB3]|uniref:hypothetical protein n=1 Tax=Halobacteriovorax sp. GB3 TaxID=2719615 RepID=UPI002361F3F3|nr:hypothetical protein [Halobacteriovorax sp. GB3]MDD0852850.1 hypothetical protein [Halobacteriovorax sp. GB3]
MKKMMTLALLISTSAFATVKNSSYAALHNKALVEAITNECNEMKDLTIVTTKEEIDQVDQGITDYYYTTVLTGKQRYDQNIFDKYTITVESSYLDGYDRSTGESGTYFVNSVKCSMND